MLFRLMYQPRTLQIKDDSMLFLGLQVGQGLPQAVLMLFFFVVVIAAVIEILQAVVVAFDNRGVHISR